jgi:hypothetical protein
LKPIRSSVLLLCAAAMLVPLTACGGGSDADPQEVLDTALSSESLFSAPVGDAEVEVASLGFEDAVLESRVLAIDRDTNETIREALAGSATESSGSAGSGNAGNADSGGAGRGAGLSALIGNLSTEGPANLDGVEVERVTGSIDVDQLVDRIRPLTEQPGAQDSDAIPGVGQLDQLENSLVAAEFELFAAETDGSLERFDLILALDDPENALPPSRIRFSLTRADPGGDAP